MRLFRVALAFLTVIPTGITSFRGPDELARSACYFPLVGLLLGLLSAGLVALTWHLLPAAPLVVLVLLILFFLTGGLHLDGLADTVDGLLGGLQKERALEIMKDGPVGPLGAAVIVLLYLWKYAALHSTGGSLLLALLLVMPVSGRWSMVMAGAAFGPARQDGLGSQFIGGLTWGRFVLSTICPLALVALALWGKIEFAPVLLCGLTFALAGAYLFARFAARRLDGLTGDVLGAVNELAEAAFLLGALAGDGLWTLGRMLT